MFVDEDVIKIVHDIETRGETALLEWGTRFGDIRAGEPYLLTKDVLKQAFDELPDEKKLMLIRVAARIKAFAQAQKSCLTGLLVSVPGGSAGHTLAPVDTVGCYAPGGRYPLPSSVLMSVIPARVAGVKRVCVASPRPQPITLAAAYVAGADELLAIGGAQAIAAMAFGCGRINPCDMIVGPGNRFVTAAKKYLFGRVGIDMLAGPTDLLIIADDSANAEWIAADLLAQAEHDVDAKPMLVCMSQEMISKVECEISKVLVAGSIASQSLPNGFAIVASDMSEAAQIVNRISPEHLQLCCADAPAIAPMFTSYGAIFIGEKSAEVFGDYGFGPNHTLPTCGGARFTGGLNVFTFLRVQTFLQVDDLNEAKEAVLDAQALAQSEGLSMHAQAAAVRMRN